MMSAYRVLIADDEPSIHRVLQRICEHLGWDAASAKDGHEALALLEQGAFQICILDVHMEGPSGVELAERIIEKEPTAAIIIFTGYAQIDDAVKAIKRGVCEYVNKETAKPEHLIDILNKAAEFHENRKMALDAQSERNRHFDDAAAANQTFQAIVDLCNELIFVLDAGDDSIQDCNLTAIQRLGHSRDSLIGRSFNELCGESFSSSWETLVSMARARRSVIHETVMKKPDGNEFAAELSCDYVALESGQFISIIARDITERKQAEQELLESKKQIERFARKLKVIVDSMEYGILLSDADGAISMANQAASRLLNATEEMLMESKLEDVLNETANEDCQPLIDGYRSGDQVLPEKKNVQIADTRVSLAFLPVIVDERVENLIVTLTDISEYVNDREDEISSAKRRSEYLETRSEGISDGVDHLISMTQSLAGMSLSDEQRVVADAIIEIAESIRFHLAIAADE